jgi:hypothetical protein
MVAAGWSWRLAASWCSSAAKGSGTWVASDPSFRPVMLLTRLLTLAEAIVELREAQGILFETSE